MVKSDDTYRKIWGAVATVPFGRVATYGQIAVLAGFPRHARLVGYALHHTPDDVDIPWHRIINAQGRISFPKDSEPYKRQLDRLAEEGVEFIRGRVDLSRHGWQPTLDEWLWKPPD